MNYPRFGPGGGGNIDCDGRPNNSVLFPIKINSMKDGNICKFLYVLQKIRMFINNIFRTAPWCRQGANILCGLYVRGNISIVVKSGLPSNSKYTCLWKDVIISSKYMNFKRKSIMLDINLPIRNGKGTSPSNPFRPSKTQISTFRDQLS